MFNKNEKKRIIWDIVNTTKSGIMQDGKTIIYPKTDAVTICSIEAIAEMSINKLKNNGFKVQRVAPKKANCVIRVFRHTNIPYDGDIFWVYGADAFVKIHGKMYSSYGAIINYSDYTMRKWLFQDDYFDMKPHFVDFFFKVTKK